MREQHHPAYVLPHITDGGYSLEPTHLYPKSKLLIQQSTENTTMSKRAFEGSYIMWRNVRFNRIVKNYGEEFFEGKTLLEVGCGHGDFGSLMAGLGAIVTAVDARAEHIEVAQQIYPHLKFYVWDLNRGLGTDEKFDIILHTGTLYHLEKYIEPITEACNQCEHLILETEVADSDKHDYVIYNVNEQGDGFDQSFTGKGVRPSSGAIEKVLGDCGFSHNRVIDNLDSGGFHRYDWTPNYDGNWEPGRRAFWFCERIKEDATL